MTPSSAEAAPSQAVLDVKGLLCPLPVIRTQNRVRTLGSGDMLTVLATDPGAMHDIPAWCRIHGHEIVSSFREERLCTITIRVKKP